MGQGVGGLAAMVVESLYLVPSGQDAWTVCSFLCSFGDWHVVPLACREARWALLGTTDGVGLAAHCSKEPLCGAVPYDRWLCIAGLTASNGC